MSIATTTIIPQHTHEGKSEATTIEDTADYIMNPEKTDGGRLVSGYMCDPDTVAYELIASKQIYAEITGRKERRENNVLFYSVRQAFKPGEITPELAHELGQKLAAELSDGKHQYIVCTHIDKDHCHNHIMLNSTTLDCSRKFDNQKDSAFIVREISDKLCREYGLSVVEEPSDKGKSYGEWKHEKQGTSWKSAMKQSIDEIIPRCENWADFLAAMESAGYEQRRGRNKRVSFRAPGQERFSRIDRLGKAYSQEAIEERIACKTLNPLAPKVKGLKKSTDTVKAMFNLDELEGGLKHWAKGQNVKQAMKSLAYLRDHGLAGPDDLAARLDEKTTAFNALSSDMKALENSMTDNTALQKHINNYARTKDIYREYQKSRHKDKFMESHRPEILRHEAAKKAFQSMGVNKLPKVAELRADFESMKGRKDSLYQEYRAAQKELRELQAVSQNMESLLQSDTDRKQSRDTIKAER